MQIPKTALIVAGPAAGKTYFTDHKRVRIDPQHYAFELRGKVPRTLLASHAIPMPMLLERSDMTIDGVTVSVYADPKNPPKNWPADRLKQAFYEAVKAGCCVRGEA